MAKSEIVEAMDALQARLQPLLKSSGFRKRGRMYNRSTPDRLVQVIWFQTGPFEPPGTIEIPPFRMNLYGQFTINIGVWVPEVGECLGHPVRPFVHEADCCIRARLGLLREGRDLWWKVGSDHAIVEELTDRFQNDCFPFFKDFETRDQILAEWRNATENTELMVVPRIVCAVILLRRGRIDEAADLLSAQYRDALVTHPGHAEYVRGLAAKLGIALH